MTQERDIPDYLSDINERSAMLKAAVVFGTILHSASRMDEHNPDPRFDHREAAFLLNNLSSNLTFIDELSMKHATLAE
ncbi:hypothetical protein A3C23_01930 [Candidatus Roizmanbacteria bacterium RIFCSPHIGHO2_02_FULL_37_13b]|uniref:Uncharacterized protein n=1 Tax=Candidatus Roizmanbacteria bacterium RIFCSPLOWO2_02_FULL_36_11 TaxID=1802071 RepID=A0A1F7JBP9_9BACT|nr:MAG: hypothetical protein A3C23_01930 [Candidatus Roizmanbacteria bacterium RIFCSPHIGHO2_02_FULL_37_13b]OGK53011.1 MAG: hypothetical protein A3H78_02250 [Candidatus Roizmanbacteria bacterium RIFCSPLOWO2_02_FULL_36_11]